VRRYRLAILGDSPCHLCKGANCCRQNGHDYAVLLEDHEYRRFAPYAVDFVIEHARVRIVEKVLPYINGQCGFLGADQRCLIYDDRPENCRNFQCIAFYHNNGRTSGEHGLFLHLNPEILQMLDNL